MAYQYDKAGRVKTITAQAKAAGPSYTTEYVYDPAGNLEKIIDPFSGETDFVYDEVNRRAQRTLPNGMVTGYGYEDPLEALPALRDKDNFVRLIEHKATSSCPTRIALSYYRKAKGEPWRIERDYGAFANKDDGKGSEMTIGVSLPSRAFQVLTAWQMNRHANHSILDATKRN